jgi:hypothetical protein
MPSRLKLVLELLNVDSLYCSPSLPNLDGCLVITRPEGGGKSRKLSKKVSHNQ